MQVENFEFDSLKLKLDAIQPHRIRRKAEDLKLAALRLDALQESLAVFQSHAQQSVSSFEHSISRLQKVCTAVTDSSCRPVDTYTFDVLNLTHELSKNRQSEHSWLESTIMTQLGRNWTQVVDENSLRLERLEGLHERIRNALQLIVKEFNTEQELRLGGDEQAMGTVSSQFVQLERALPQCTKSTLGLVDILSDLATSVSLELRQCKQQRQPIEKLIYDKLSALCDHLRDNLEFY